MNRAKSIGIEQHVASAEYQERLRRDSALTGRIKAGYTPVEQTRENPQPRIIDGTLDEDAQEALGELFLHYERLAAREARRYSARAHNRSSLGVEDLTNQGYFGIYHAAITYDPDLGVGFMSHAQSVMGRYLKRYLKQHDSLIRLPSDMSDAVRQYEYTTWLLYETQGHFPTREQVAEAMGIQPEQVEKLDLLRTATDRMGSTDRGYFADGCGDDLTPSQVGEGRWQPVHPENTVTCEVESEVTSKIASEIIRQYLKDFANTNPITQCEAELIVLRFFGNRENGWQSMSCKQIAEVFSKTKGKKYSQKRIRKIEAHTFMKLRHPHRVDKLRGLT